MEDPDEVLFPSRDLVLVALSKDESQHCIPFTALDDLLLYLRHGSAIKTLASGLLTVSCRYSGLPGEISDCIQDSPGESIRLPPLQPPVEYLAYIAAGPPKVDVILVIGHRVLERDVSRKLIFVEGGRMYSNHSQEYAGRTESDLSWRNGTRVLCDTQNLNKDV